MSEPAGKVCIACGSTNLSADWGITSSFFAHRALHEAPRPVRLLQCIDCETRHFDIAVSTDQLGRLYADYRGEQYFLQRHKLEPWYSRGVNDEMGGKIHMRQRREILAEALRECGHEKGFGAALDHGGDRGQMLLDIAAERKAVFEISGASAEPGITAIDREAMRGGGDGTLYCPAMFWNTCRNLVPMLKSLWRLATLAPYIFSKCRTRRLKVSDRPKAGFRCAGFPGL